MLGSRHRNGPINARASGNAIAARVLTLMTGSPWGSRCPRATQQPATPSGVRARPRPAPTSSSSPRAQADRAAFALIYRRYVDAIYGYGYRRLGSREAAEDLTSLVFARALEALPRFRAGSVRGWLFTIAHHAIANDLRGLATRRTDPLDAAAEIADTAAGPEAAAIDADDRRTLDRLMAQLPERDRQSAGASPRRTHRRRDRRGARSRRRRGPRRPIPGDRPPARPARARKEQRRCALTTSSPPSSWTAFGMTSSPAGVPERPPSCTRPCAGCMSPAGRTAPTRGSSTDWSRPSWNDRSRRPQRAAQEYRDDLLARTASPHRHGAR